MQTVAVNSEYWNTNLLRILHQLPMLYRIYDLITSKCKLARRRCSIRVELFLDSHLQPEAGSVMVILSNRGLMSWKAVAGKPTVQAINFSTKQPPFLEIRHRFECLQPRGKHETHNHDGQRTMKAQNESQRSVSRNEEPIQALRSLDAIRSQGLFRSCSGRL
jgi:hypothetical protein